MSFDGEALRTERLVNSDPTVTEFLGRRIDAAATAAFLDRTRDRWAEHGFGHWAIEPTEGPLAGDTIGFVGIAFPTFLPELATRPELGSSSTRSGTRS